MDQQRYYDKHKRDQEARRFYKSREWLECREFVLKRDHYLCQQCLKEDRLTKADMVHHKEELKDSPEKSLDMNNLISLCNRCHNKEHSGKPKQKRKGKRKIKVIKARANPEIF